MPYQVYSTEQVAQQLGISVRRVQAMIKAGQINAHKLGRDWIIGETEVIRLVGLDRKPGRPKKSAL